MPTLIDNLNLINSYKSDIKSAIENKGVDMTGVSFGSYADKIGEITTTFVTETLNVTQNNTYYPGQGVDGFSEVVVNVPQTGYNEKDVTERNFGIVNLSNSASFVSRCAFQYYSPLETVYLPSCLEVRDYGFYNCTKLSSVYLPICSVIGISGLANTGITSITLPSCKSMGMYGLYWCQKLTYVDLPICSYLSDYAFAQCPSLSSIFLRSTSVCTAGGPNVLWGDNSVYVYVPLSLVSSYQNTGYWRQYWANRIRPILEELEYLNGLVIGSATSMDSTYLTTLGISSNDVISVSMPYLTSLASSTFMDCQNLVSVSFPLLDYLPDDTFNGCISLSEYTILISSLGDRVFANCTGLETITISYMADVVAAGSDLFSNCPNLTHINVPMGWVSSYVVAPGWSEYSSLISDPLPELAFANGILFGSISSIRSGFLQSLAGVAYNDITSVNLPNCTYVGESTFYGMSRLNSVNLPVCSYIGRYGVGECSQMYDVYIPLCEYIGENAFRGDFRIPTTGLDLPVCSYIGSSAFYWCLSLVSVTLGYSSVVSGTYAFANLGTNPKFYVPASLVNAYKASTILGSYSQNVYPIPE